MFAGLLLPICAANVTAQIGNQSDITGISITSSSVVSPVFPVSIGRPVRIITFLSPGLATSFQQAAALLKAQLGSQVFASKDGTQSAGGTQNLVYEVATGGNTSAQSAARLVAVLTEGNSSPATIASAEAFVESFRGLLTNGIAMDPRSFNALTATQLANAVAAYNAFIDSSNESFLSAPPPELTAIHGVLKQFTSH